jgi:hypothetical protein
MAAVTVIGRHMNKKRRGQECGGSFGTTKRGTENCLIAN